MYIANIHLLEIAYSYKAILILLLYVIKWVSLKRKPLHNDKNEREDNAGISNRAHEIMKF